jgi:hypothetical protein
MIALAADSWREGALDSRIARQYQERLREDGEMGAVALREVRGRFTDAWVAAPALTTWGRGDSELSPQDIASELVVAGAMGVDRQESWALLPVRAPMPEFRVPSHSLRKTEDLDEWAQRLALVFGHDLADSPPVLMKQVGAYRAHDARGDLKDLRDIPTLVVGAAEDLLSPPSVGRSLAEGIPRGSVSRDRECSPRSDRHACQPDQHAPR